MYGCMNRRTLLSASLLMPVFGLALHSVAWSQEDVRPHLAFVLERG